MRLLEVWRKSFFSLILTQKSSCISNVTFWYPLWETVETFTVRRRERDDCVKTICIAVKKNNRRPKTRLKWSCIFIMWHISQLAHSASNDTEQKASDAQIRALLLNSTSRKQKLHPPPADERHLNFKAMRGRRKFTNVCIQIMLKREKWALPDSFYIHRPLLEWMHFANKHIFSACSSPPQHSSQGKWK